MEDFIYDDQGACVAWIAEGKVFSELSKRPIAEIRDGMIYTFDDRLVGHLQGAGFVREGGDTAPAAFLRLVKEV